MMMSVPTERKYSRSFHNGERTNGQEGKCGAEGGGACEICYSNSFTPSVMKSTEASCGLIKYYCHDDNDSRR